VNAKNVKMMIFFIKKICPKLFKTSGKLTITM
jgi:hypothetical protein